MEKWRTSAELMIRFSRKVKKDRVRAHSAEAAFFIILSFFPVLMLFFTLIQFTPIKQDQVIFIIEEITPFAITSVIRPAVEGYAMSASAVVSWTAVVALWAAGKGVMGMSDGLNSIYQIRETKHYFAVRIRSACYVFVMLLALLVSIGILVLGYGIESYLRLLFPVLEAYRGTIVLLPLLTAAGLLVVLFAVLYSFLPYKRMRFRSQVPGAIFTTIAWTVFSYVFSVYLDFAENMSKIYGGLTTLAVAMLWLYFCMYIFFIGAEINDYLSNPERIW